MTDINTFLKCLPFETERLRIRQYRLTDLVETLRMSQDPILRKWTLSGVFNDEEHKEYVSKSSSDSPKDFILEDKLTGAIVGEMTFHLWTAERTWEIGWLVLPSCQGLGYASEAAKKLIEIGFGTMELHRIIAKATPENKASCRVMEKVGMRKEGLFKQCIPREDGSWWDEICYGILAAEWKP
ncbi:GNAT family N-acetyltransferase [Kiloniella antarctica]|uniref:GNAT family N-acetyltransferase n=1 Tax=Kiloniella antarctica TaxID=1550907 RepID=A0ABW5BGJ9_9PROT